jgi:hypothetical protein
MKLMINKNIRKGLIFIFVVTVLILSFLIFNEIYNPGYEEQKNTIYTYNNKGSINYSVYLKPNKLYNGNVLDEGKLYITEFVDYIDTNLKYEFTGEKSNNIKANYSIIAKVQGFTIELDEIKNIWEKDFPIVLDKTINSYEDKILINEKVKLNLNDYNTFVKEIMETSKINCQTNLSLLMNVNISGSTNKGPIKDSIVANLIIPLDVTMFEILGNNIVDKPGAIDETVKVQLPVNKTQILIFGIILAILLITLIVLIFFIQIAPEKDQLEKELNIIFKKHGDRLVTLNSDIDLENAISVKSIDDIVKIADEVGKPILYKYSDNYKEINKFYVTNNDEVFLYVLAYSDIIELVEDKIETIENTTEQIKTESQLNL